MTFVFSSRDYSGYFLSLQAGSYPDLARLGFEDGVWSVQAGADHIVSLYPNKALNGAPVVIVGPGSQQIDRALSMVIVRRSPQDMASRNLGSQVRTGPHWVLLLPAMIIVLLLGFFWNAQWNAQ